MTAVVEQLNDFCDCLPDMKEDVLERNVLEMISLISNLTCWTQQPCETFLNSERVEFIDFDQFDPCSCNGGIVEFTPYYHPFQSDTFKVTLIEQDGINETATELDASDFAYSDTFGVLRINLRDYVSNSKCGCSGASKLMITYDAGYESIPECLLQIFCDLLHVITVKNSCDCSACQACTGEDDVTIEYSEDDDVSPKLSVYLNSLIESGYKKQLGLISLCQGCNEIWGLVV